MSEPPPGRPEPEPGSTARPEPLPPLREPAIWEQETAPRDGSVATPVAWVLYAGGVVLLAFVGLFTLFGVAQASSGCRYADADLRPGFCGSAVLSAVVWLAPLLAILGYVVGGAVGIVALRRTRWPIAAPLGLGGAALGVLIGTLAYVS